MQKIKMLNIIYSIYFDLIIIVLLLLSFILVNNKIRVKFWKLHKFSGYLYFAFSILVCAYIIYNTFVMSYGHIAESGMRITTLLWLFYLANGFRFMLKKRVFAHRIWMIRAIFINIAFTLSPIFLAFLEFFGNNYPLYIAISYTFNVIIVSICSYIYLNKNHTVIKNP